MPNQLVQGLGAFGVLCLLCTGPTSGGLEAGGTPYWAVRSEFLYSSFQRSMVDPTVATTGGNGLVDGGDTTFHAVAIEVSRVRPAEDGLGGGAPRGEVALGFAVAPSHDEGTLKAYADLPRIATTGDGRSESVWFRGRVPVGRTGSLELSVERPYFTEADVVITGTDLYFGASLRNLLTDVRNVAAGYRFFGHRFDVALHVLWTNIRMQWGTGKSFLNYRGDVLGADLDGEMRLGAWRIIAACGAESGHLRTQGGFYPAFVPYEDSPYFRRRHLVLGTGRTFGRLALAATAGGVFLEAPYWDSGAITSTEGYRIDEGRSYVQSSRQAILDLTAFYRFSETFSAEGGFQHVTGDENARFPAASPGVGDLSASFRRRGWAYRLGLGFQIR